jgi:hypothetical protein
LVLNRPRRRRLVVVVDVVVGLVVDLVVDLAVLLLQLLARRLDLVASHRFDVRRRHQWPH